MIFGRRSGNDWQKFHERYEKIYLGRNDFVRIMEKKKRENVSIRFWIKKNYFFKVLLKVDRSGDVARYNDLRDISYRTNDYRFYRIKNSERLE